MVMTPADYATAAAIAVLGAWSWWHATRMARAEAEVIAENIEQGFTDELPHDVLVWWRIEWIGSAWAAVGLVMGWWVNWWLLLPLAAIAWAVFTLRHRYALNRARGFDWRYVAPGNNYDRFWMRVSGECMRRPDTWTARNWSAFVKLQHDHGYDLDDLRRQRVHRAGLLAYAFEVLVATGAVVVAMWIA